LESLVFQTQWTPFAQPYSEFTNRGVPSIC